MKVLDLFSGIGGFSLGLERAGFETVAFCEIDPFCRKVLNKHWPNVPIYEDVRNVSKSRLDADGIRRVDVVTGGFPCQDVSIAGKQAGIGEGTRSGLWSELHRIIGDIRPDFAVLENVTNLLSGECGGWFSRILGDLAEIGYDAEWHCIPAHYAGSLQARDRVWIIANPCKNRKQRLLTSGDFGAVRQGWQGSAEDLQRIYDAPFERGNCHPEPLLRGMARRIPARVDRVGAVGNSVYPAIPEIIGRAIMKAEQRQEAA